MSIRRVEPDSPVELARLATEYSQDWGSSLSVGFRSFPRRFLPVRVTDRAQPDLCDSFDYFDSTAGGPISTISLWLITFAAGVTIGCVKGAVFWFSYLLWTARIDNMSAVAEEEGSIFSAMGVYVGYAVVSALAASLLVLFLSLAAGGGGIADIKTFLNGNLLPGFLCKRTLLARVLGVSLVTSSGAMAGPEGPMAHVGTIITVLVAEAYTSLSDKQKYDFATVGSGMGIASAFNAPLAGTLFALEEAASFWHPELVSRTFFGALVTAVVGEYVSAGFACANETFCVSIAGEFAFTSESISASYFRPWELPLFGLVGLLVGIAAVGLSVLIFQLAQFRQKWYAKRILWRVMDAILVFGITAIGFSLLTLAGSCVSSSELPTESNPSISTSLCTKPATFNPISLLLLEPRTFAIQSLFSATSAELFSQSALVLSAIAVFVSAAFTTGLSLPAGLFIPMVLCGACIGRLFGVWVSLVTGVQIFPGVYALAGAAGFLSGVSRMTVWIALVMVESSDNLNLTVPVMVAIVSAKFLADYLQPVGLYDQLILAKNVKYVPHEEEFTGDPNLCVKDVMSAPAICFFQREQQSLLTHVASQCTHSSFPVIDADERVLGIVKRVDLPTETGSKNWESAVCSVPISFVPISLSASFPARKCYYIFSQLGVKVVPVVDESNRILGIVTRENFMHK